MQDIEIENIINSYKDNKISLKLSVLIKNSLQRFGHFQVTRFGHHFLAQVFLSKCIKFNKLAFPVFTFIKKYLAHTHLLWFCFPADIHIRQGGDLIFLSDLIHSFTTQLPSQRIHILEFDPPFLASFLSRDSKAHTEIHFISGT